MPRRAKLQEATHLAEESGANKLHGDNPTEYVPPPPATSDQAPDKPTETILSDSGMGSEPPAAADKKDERPLTGIEPDPTAAPGVPRVISTVKRELACLLTQTELHDMALQLANTFDEIAVAESQRKKVLDDLNGRMKALYRKQSELAQAVQRGEQIRMVDIDFILLGDGETISEVRKDTGKPVATRKATDFERQGQLFVDRMASQVFNEEPPPEGEEDQ